MWESFRTSLRHDLLPEERRRSEEHGRVLPSMTIKNALYGDNAGVSVGSFRYAPESVWEIERCVLESDNHEAATRLVAAVTTSGKYFKRRSGTRMEHCSYRHSDFYQLLFKSFF